MTDVSKRFEQLVKSSYKRFAEQGYILPVKTSEGICVGNVLIRNKGSLKYIVKSGAIVYNEISLNSVAIKLANLLALDTNKALRDELYQLDHLYSKHFVDSKFFLDNYHRAVNSNNEVRADILWTRYIEAKERAIALKEKAEHLASF